MKPLLLLGAALYGAFTAAGAQTLTPPRDRISDAAIQADHRSYEAAQDRLRALNARGRPLRDYHLAKAQCWLDVSVHEYTRNDRSAFPQAALDESMRLTAGMEQGGPLGWETPLVNGAARLREDLWQRTVKLRPHVGWACAAAKVACAEVELVHAGHEWNQQQWRHAQPYVQIAEDLLADAEQAAVACMPPPAPPAPPAPPPPPAPPVQELRTVSASVVFNFDRHGVTDIRPWSLRQLEALVDGMKRDGGQVTGVRLVGHADRLNNTGQSDYNERLSEKRVATVASVLQRLGLPPGLISTGYKGDQQQVQACQGRFKDRADLEECLLPNRRVEVLIDSRFNREPPAPRP